MKTFIKFKIFRNKKNIYMFIQFIISIVFLLFALNFKYNFYNLLNDRLSQNIGFRSLSVTVKPDCDDLGKEELLNIKNVITVYNSKYDSYSVDSNFKSNLFDGKINLLYSEENILPKIIKGSAIKNSEEGVAICPIKFYPSSNANNFLINNSEILNANDLINTTFESIYYSYKNNNGNLEKDKRFVKKFKIVGLYDANSSMNALNSCYISKNDMVSMKKDTFALESDTYNNFIVVVDNIKNIPKVEKDILDLGFLDVNIRSEIDKKTVKLIKISCDVIITIIVCSICISTIFYVKKKTLDERKNFKILRSIGFTKNNVLMLSIIEQFSINLFLYIIGSIIFLFIYLLLRNYILSKYFITSLSFILFFKSFIYSFIYIVILPLIIEMYYIIKINKDFIVDIDRSIK